MKIKPPGEHSPMDELSRAPTRFLGSAARMFAVLALAGPVVAMDAAKHAFGQADAFEPSKALGRQWNADLNTALVAGGKVACTVFAVGAFPLTYALSLFALVPAVRAGNDPQEPWADLWGNRSPNPNA